MATVAPDTAARVSGSSKPLTRVAIAGATGYAGQELVRILARHPAVQLTDAMSSGTTSAPRPLPALRRIWDGAVTPLDVDRLASADIVFLALPEAASAEVGTALVNRGVRVIDLSGAFRLRGEAERRRWYPATSELPAGVVYGLPERSADAIREARLVSCPGCYPTAALLALQSALASLVAACADQAEQAGTALMPSYTHLRRAQPVLVAHYFLAHAAALRRDHARLAAAAEEANALTLGSGAVAGTSYPVDTKLLAQKLGFSRIVLNSMDASSDRDFVAAFLYAVSLAMVHLSRLAEDLVIFTGEEHGFFELSDASATGSSMMPQKKNPDPLELVRGKTGRAIGRLTGWLATMKGLPSGYNKDLQEDKEAVFDAETTLGASINAAHAVVSRLSLNAERTERAASGLLLATDVADYLVSRGMPFRRAHEVVGAMVRRLLAEGRDFSALTLEEWREASEMFGDDAPRAATALASVQARRTPQSTNPTAVRDALDECRSWLVRVNPKSQ